MDPDIIEVVDAVFPTISVPLNNNADIENDKVVSIDATKSRLSSNQKRNIKVVPSEFEHWIKNHGGVQQFNSRVYRPQRGNRSSLCNTVYTSSDESCISSTNEEEDQQQRSSQIPPPPMTAEKKEPKRPFSKTSSMNTNTDIENKKKNKWLSGLFQKQSSSSSSFTAPTSGGSNIKSSTATATVKKNSAPSKTSATVTKTTNNISNFFSVKKLQKEQPEKKHALSAAAKPLPKRYPIIVERVICQISFLKLNNARRPLQQQVVVSNMLTRFTLIIKQEQEEQRLVSSTNRKQTYYTNSVIPTRAASFHNYQVAPMKAAVSIH